MLKVFVVIHCYHMNVETVRQRMLMRVALQRRFKLPQIKRLLTLKVAGQFSRNPRAISL